MCKSYIERNEGFITHSKLQDFMKCQYYYKLRYIDKVLPDSTGDHFTIGRAFEDYLNDNQKNWFVVGRRNKNNTNELTPRQGETIDNMVKEIKERQPLFHINKKQSQVEIITNYKGYKLKATMDQFDEKKELISDYKTCASIDKFQNWISKYKDQLTFYQFVVQLEKDILCDGELQVVTKEDVSKSLFLYAEKESLMDNRGALISELDNMIETLDLGIFASSALDEKCIKCDAWNKCPHTIQKKHILI